MSAATQSLVTYYLWEELSAVQQSQALRTHPETDGMRTESVDCWAALWFRGPVDGGRWERIPLHPSDAARFRYAMK